MKHLLFIACIVFAPGCGDGVTDQKHDSAGNPEGKTAQDDSFTNPFGMKFVLVHPEKSSKDLSHAFLLQTHEVTVAQVESVVRRTGEVTAQPVKGVDASRLIYGFEAWLDAKDFAQKLSRLDTTYLYRLPSAAEWRAGCEGQVDFSPAQPSNRDPANYLGDFRNENRFGLHNMLSGFAEYTNSDFIVDADVANSKRIAEGNDAKVVMGQTVWSATLGQYQCRCDQQTPVSKAGTSLTIGVRLVAEKK